VVSQLGDTKTVTYNTDTLVLSYFCVLLLIEANITPRTLHCIQELGKLRGNSDQREAMVSLSPLFDDV
jgi:hypothetical protein